MVKIIKKNKKLFIVPILFALLLLMIFKSANADEPEPWTAYGRAGHASVSGDTVNFVGHQQVPFTTLLFRAASDGDYRTLTFHLSEGRSDWHTLQGSGFIYNAGIVDGKLSGDAILFSASNVALYRITNVPIGHLASYTFSAIPGVTLVETKPRPTYSSGTTWYLKIVMSPGSIKVEKHTSPTFDGEAEVLFKKTFSASERSPYSGYGPFASFVSHNCSSISTSSFQHFTLTIKPNTPPVMSAQDVTLRRGETYNFLFGVSAYDAEDGDLTRSAQPATNNADADIPGVYRTAYSVADILGLTAATERTVTVLADAYFYAYDRDTGEPVPGVGIATNADTDEDTNEAGETSSLWVTPGTYEWEVTRQHPDYLPLAGRREVQIEDDGASTVWPMRIPVPLERKYRDAAVALALESIAGETDSETARFNQEALFHLNIANNGNEAARITANITAPDTLELLCAPVVTTEILNPGDSATYAVPCRVVSLLDADTATLRADVTKIALADTGETVADENPENDAAIAAVRIQNVPVEITKTDALTGEPMEGVLFEMRSGDAPVPFIRMENGAFIKADVAPIALEEDEVVNLHTGHDGKLTLYGLEPGAYAMVETSPLPGYVLPAEPWQLVIGEDAQAESETAFTNEPTVMTIKKTDATTQEPLDGAFFRILDEGGKPVLLTLQENGAYYPYRPDENGEENEETEKGEETFTTKKGEAVLRYLPIGKYTLEETKAPAGYAANKAVSYEITSEHAGDTPKAITVTNNPLALLIRKITKANIPLTGAGFTITAATEAMRFTRGTDGVYRPDNFGKEITLKVNESGEILLYGLPADTYTVAETIVPDEYMATAPQRVTLTDTYTSEKPYELRIVNEPFVKLGLDNDRWVLPVAIALLLLAAGFTVTLILKKKTGAWWFARFFPKGQGAA